MKLELKHIVGYLGHGLKCALMGEVRDEYADMPEPKLFTLNGIITESISKITFFSCDDEDFHHEVESIEIFPILRPLSDLTKEIEVHGKRLIPIEKLNKLYPEYPLFIEDEHVFLTDNCNLNMLEIHEINKIYQKLYAWHFDLHDLIKNNLAIDISTIK